MHQGGFLTIDPVAKRVVGKGAKNVVVSRDIAPDPEIDSIIATYQARSAKLANRVVGHISADITKSVTGRDSCETTLGDVIADAQLGATKDASLGGAVIAFMNRAGFASISRMRRRARRETASSPTPKRRRAAL